jgi:hypothetical protein
VAQQQGRQYFKRVANNLAPLDTSISLTLRGQGGMADAWLQLLWLATATVVHDVLHWLREKENSIGAPCYHDNINAFVYVVWQKQWQFEDGNWTMAIGQQWWDSNDVMMMGGQSHAE